MSQTIVKSRILQAVNKLSKDNADKLLESASSKPNLSDF